MFAKNERIIEVSEFLTHIISQPTKLFHVKFKTTALKYQSISSVLMMIRSLQSIDKTHILKEKVNGIQPLYDWENFDLTRSFEIIKDFQCSQNTSKSLIACFINRTLHVYDFIYQKFLFKANLPNLSYPSDLLHKSLLFLDDDQVILVRDGNRRLVLLSIA